MRIKDILSITIFSIRVQQISFIIFNIIHSELLFPQFHQKLRKEYLLIETICSLSDPMKHFNHKKSNYKQLSNIHNIKYALGLLDILQILHQLKMKSQLMEFSATTNEQKIDQDYMTYYDYYWTRTELYPVTYNNIIFHIEQPLQNEVYQGYFYLEDIHIYQFRCVTGCESCYTIDYCTPCLNPANKNPADCTCLSGFTKQGDVCVPCPTYCTACTVAGACDSCLGSTLRINPPSCDACPNQYYLSPNFDNCQSCIVGCKVCVSSFTCINCLVGYFKDSFELCITQCVDGYFNDGSDPNNPLCTLCDANCLKCSTSGTTCTACKGTATLINNHCYSCPEGKFLQGTTCMSCQTGCITCVGVVCSACADSYFLQLSTNICMGQCNSNQFGNVATRTCDSCNSQCLTCAGPTNSDCISCGPGLVLNVQNVLTGYCQTTCLIGFYRLGDICAKCWKGCASCVDSTQACLSCASKYYRYKSNGYCYDVCPIGLYNNSLGYVCSPCNSNCKTCNGSTELNCLSCTAPLAYYQNQCLTNCPETYGSVNQVCQQCTSNCKQCFGTAPNECSVCGTGFYYLKNQCYVKCPTSFIGVRPQYICKCVYENCISCTATQYFYSNQCYDICPEGTYGFNGLCVKCDITCGMCFGEGQDQCLSCNSPLILFRNKCIQECTGNTFHDLPTNSCQYCHETCLACSGPNDNDCTACFDIQLLSVERTCVDQCPDKSYPVLSEKKCSPCHPTCETCFGGAIDNCLTCSNLFYLYQCVSECPDGFQMSTNKVSCEPSFEIVLTECSYQCTTCELTARFCTGCSGNRLANPPSCDCDNGYYDDGSSINCIPCANKCQTCKVVPSRCITCKGDRLLPNCACPVYYYDDGSSANCIKCQDNCFSCNGDGCILCLNDRINPPDCICPDGYYEAYKLYCQQCAKKCATCAESDQLCLTCSDIRINPPICNCPDGYFENSDEDCQKCSSTCIDCNQQGCLSCAANRVGPVDGVCGCAKHGVSRFSIGSVYCTDCSTGVPYFTLNDDFTGFSYSFGGQIETNVDSICDLILDPGSLQLLGTNPVCDTSQNIFFGTNPTIQVGDIIQLKPAFTLLGCSQPFDTIQSMPLQISFSTDLTSHLPIIDFNQLDSPNVCAPTTIEFAQKKYNGGQQLKIHSWNIILPTDPDQHINFILQDNIANNSEIITFPIKSFQSGTQYKFAVTVESFAKLINTLYVQFQPVSHSTIIVSTQPFDNQFHRYDSMTITFVISYYNCIEKNPPSQNLTYKCILKNNKQLLLEGSITEGLIDGFVQNLPLSFDAYYFNFSNPYTIVFTTTLIREDYQETTTKSVDVYIVQSAPSLSIAGGNRMIGYADSLYLNTTITDQDFTPIEASTMNYTCFWSCTDIVNGTECLDITNQTLQFNNKCQQQFPSKTFAPYKVFNFQVVIIKNLVEYSTKVSIQIIELDLPALKVTGIDQEILHNYYDQFILKLEYPGINPDLLMYAGAVIYDNVVQATFQFYYLDFKFKLQDYFTNLTTEIGTGLRLRLSIYDPRYIMPSLNTQVMFMNIPPQYCQISYELPDSLIEFIDQITINVNNCYDADTPLLYSVQLYPNETIYKSDLLKSHFYHYLLVVPPQMQNSFQLVFPYFSQDPQLIVINIEDSQGGITNITSLIDVKQYYNISSDTFLNYLNQQNTLDQQLVAYRIVIERLARISGLTDLKETLYNKLIFTDQNQTLSSNQTESLYHAISIMVGQNSSLLQFNETQFYTQLCSRITAAGQQLIYLNYKQVTDQYSSKLNIEKNNYIQQYYSFSNILSQFINFRVTFNQTASEIQTQLESIMKILQSISVANEPLYSISSNSANLNFGFLTSKLANDVTGTSLSTEKTQTNSTNFYKYSQTRYIDNPFYTSSGFPKNSSGYQAVDPKLQLQDSKDNATKLKTPLQFKFPTINKTLSANTSIKCIAEVNSGNWSANVCKTVKKDQEMICQCDTLNPTSLMESFDAILDKAAQIYSLDTLLAFASFPFYKTIIFYFYLTITVTYLSIIYWGMKVDNAMFARIQLEKEAEELLKQKEESEEKLEKRNTDKSDEKSESSIKQNLKTTIFQKNNRFLVVPQPTITKQSILISDIKLQQVAPQQLMTIQNIEDTSQIIQSDRSVQVDGSPKQDQSNFINNQNKSQTENQEQSKTHAFTDYLKFFHQILSIIYKDDPEKPRGLRATIVYTSIMGSLVILFVFNQPNNLSLTMALALITAPVNKIYQVILEKILVHKKKAVRMFGAVFMIAVAAFISYTMLAGLVLSDSVETTNKWSFIFLGSFSLDNVFYSPIQLVIQYYIHIRLINLPTIQKLLHKFLDDQAKEFIKKLLQRRR